MLVLDANVAGALAMAEDGFAVLSGEELIAPALMWSECRAYIHELVWRAELTEAEGLFAMERLESGAVNPRQPDGLGAEAWRIATSLGWARTYDAEYLALARLERCRFVTRDRRLMVGAARLGLAMTLEEYLAGRRGPA